MGSKLTLSVDSKVVARAKRYAKRNGVSVSKMVENYLASVGEPPRESELPPLVRSLRGILKGIDPGDYERYLAEKYK